MSDKLVPTTSKLPDSTRPRSVRNTESTIRGSPAKTSKDSCSFRSGS